MTQDMQDFADELMEQFGCFCEEAAEASGKEAALPRLIKMALILHGMLEAMGIDMEAEETGRLH